MRRRVVFGTAEVIATLSPHSAFTSVDLPTLGRPATATNPLFTRYPTRGTPAHHPLRSYSENPYGGGTASSRDSRSSSPGAPTSGRLRRTTRGGAPPASSSRR